MKRIHKEHFIGNLQELTIQNEEHNIALDIYTARGSTFSNFKGRGTEELYVHICAGLGPGNLNKRFNTNWNGPFPANDVGYWIARKYIVNDIKIDLPPKKGKKKKKKRQLKWTI